MSVIRCPRCSEEFPLSEIFSSLPPEAEIVSGPGSEVTIAVPVGLADTSEYSLTGESIEPKSDFQIKESGPLAGSPPMAKFDSSRPARKPKKAEPNVILEFAKIVVGGAAGLAIAVLMIMWFGHQDVFKIVPKLPPEAYFLVPDELRTAEMRELANQGNEPTETNPEADVPVESIPTQEPTEEEPVEASTDPDNQVSRNNPADNADESPLAAAFQQQVNAAKQKATPQNKPEAKPKPKPAARKVNAEMPVSEPIIAEEPAAKPMKPAEKPEVAEAPAEEPKAEPTEPTPIDSTVVEMITEASEELGPIGAEIPPPPEPSQPEAISVDNVDLSPVGDGDK
ncbi:hypothetical protein C5Y96_08685 [Blastopirellula marina]|uniref:Uncharacterized protein n=1 Tax=Blastopirellula marina TaxID=124 RepID=A0A2S8FU65_9BACT|nr:MULTISPECIES: hypothetical protein [Pirellulaceae]PQO35721.1 hypothetical protein C5Y96_08685 [Blastopirellula marina]RCS53295.1 hypothetical protein DTL36_08695 [Bremerella cremea]